MSEREGVVISSMNNFYLCSKEERNELCNILQNLLHVLFSSEQYRDTEKSNRNAGGQLTIFQRKH